MGVNNWGTSRDRWIKLNPTYYLDPVNGDDSNSGMGPNLAYKTYAKAEQVALSPGQSIAKKIDGLWLPFKVADTVQRPGWVYGYYQDGGSLTISVSDINFSGLTHISHDHIEPNTDGTLDATSYSITSIKSTALITAAHAAGVKVLINIADINGHGFTSAASPTYLPTLVNNIVQFVVGRGYDGVDIDWETGATSAGVLSLMSALYPALKTANPNFVVNMAVGAGSASGSDGTISWIPCVDYCDMMAVMCYNAYQTGGKITWFNCPLYDGNLYTFWGLRQQSCERIVKGFMHLGVPASKLCVAVPFYGLVTNGNIGASTSGPLVPRQPYTAGFANQIYLPYNQVPTYYVASGDHWDELAEVPYISVINPDPTLNAYVTYDDPSSLTAKVAWAKDLGLGGIAIWEISLDYFSGRTITTPLLDAIKVAYPKIPLVGSTPSTPTGITLQSISTTSVRLNWPVVPNATAYNVKRSLTSGSGYTTLATVSVPGYTDATLSSGTTYYYVISAVNYGVQGANSAEYAVTATAVAAPTNLVTNPTNIQGSGWSVNTSGGATVPSASTFTTNTSIITSLEQTVAVTASTNYTATIAISCSGFSFGAFNIFTTGFASLGFRGLSLTPGVVTTFQISFSSASNTSIIFDFSIPAANPGLTITVSAISLVAPGTSYVPAAPTPVSITSAIAQNIKNRYGITLTWGWAAGATSYLIKRSVITSGANYVIIATATGTSYTDNSLSPDTTFYYTISAIHASHESVNSTEVSVVVPTTYAPPNMVLSPTDISVSPWAYSGTGVSAVNATTLQCGTNVDSFLQQTGIVVQAGTNYTVMVTFTAPTVGFFALVTVYDITFANVLVTHGQFINTGTPAVIRLTFDTLTFTSLAFTIDIGPQTSSFQAGVSGIDIAVTIPSILTNLLTSPTDLTNAAWTVTGTLTGPLAMTCASSGVSGFTQQSIAVTPNTDYLITATFSRNDSFTAFSGGYAVLMAYDAGFVDLLGMEVSALIPGSPSDMFVEFNSGSATTVVFATSITSDAASSPMTFSNIKLTINPYLNAPAVLATVTTPSLSSSLSTISLGGLTYLMNGGSTTGTLTLVSAAPPAGAVIALSSNNGSLIVPATVTVPGGSNTVTFPITSTSISADATVTITASLNITQTISFNLLSSAGQSTQLYNDMTGSDEASPFGWPYSSGPLLTQGLTPPTYGSNWHALTAWGVLYQTTSGNTATNTRVNIAGMQAWWLQTSTGIWHQIQFTNFPDSAAYWDDFHDDTNLVADVRQEADGTLSATAGMGTNSKGQSLVNRNFHFYPTDRGLFTYSDYGGMFSMLQARLIVGNPSLTDDRASSQYIISMGGDYWPDLTSGLPSGYDPLGNGANPGIGNGKYKRVTNSWRTFCMTPCSSATLAAHPPPIDLTGILL